MVKVTLHTQFHSSSTSILGGRFGYQERKSLPPFLNGLVVLTEFSGVWLRI